MEDLRKNEKQSPEQKKEYTIFVNAREKKWYEKTISFDQLVLLAFGIFENNSSIAYTIAYQKGIESKSDGSMVFGDSIHVKNNMIFNVSQTNKS